MLQADDEARLDPLGLARELDVLEAPRQLGEERALRAARQVRAETEVLAVPEAHVGVRVAVDAEAEGIVEDVLVAVGRRVEEAQLVVLADRLSTHLGVARRRRRM